MTEIERRDEFRLIADFFAPLAADAPGALGLEDDAALLSGGGDQETVVTVDAMVAGVHFVGDEPAGLIARKLLRVNLSDLAAMGAAPVGYLLSAAWPDATPDTWIADFVVGLAADQREFDCCLLGGDTVSTSGPLMLSLTALGRVPTGTALRRGGAAPGDRIYVSGSVGDAALGLAAVDGRLSGIAETTRGVLIDRYQLPSPRLALGQALRGLASAAIDISDGLAADLGHIAAASGVGAEIEADKVVVAEAAKAGLLALSRPIDMVLGGGDDYELLFTAPPEAADAVAALAARLNLPLSPVGRITPAGGVRVLDADGGEIALAEAGWRHRRSDP